MDLYGGYGGYGGMGGGMGGGGSSTMMSSAAMGCLCLSVLAGGAYMMMGSSDSSSDMSEMESPPTTSETSAPSPPVGSNGLVAASGLDGSKAILVGSLAMAADAKCENKSIMFKLPAEAKTSWVIRKAGTDSKGDYYTLQSDFKSFNKICKENFLTAPLGCKSAPFLDSPRFGPQQYWRIFGSDTTGYQIQSMMCEMSRYLNNFLTASGQKQDKPVFTARAGSTFTISQPYTG